MKIKALIRVEAAYEPQAGSLVWRDPWWAEQWCLEGRAEEGRSLVFS